MSKCNCGLFYYLKIYLSVIKSAFPTTDLLYSIIKEYNANIIIKFVNIIYKYLYVL